MFYEQVNVEVLNNWLKQMEVYLAFNKIQETQQIYFSHLKITRYALLWWERFVYALRIGNNPMITKW
jgi:hypothetical protein